MARAVMAELCSTEALVRAIHGARAAGFTRLDAHTPFPAEEVGAALAIEASPIPWVVLAGGLVGAALAYLVQWFITAVEYPLDVGGRPLHPAPAFVPITYEMATLFAALAGVAAFLFLCGLPRLWHPVFELDGFESVAVDRCWLRVIVGDDERARAAAVALAQEVGAARVIVLDDEVRR